jgi:hypothetical protein
MARNKIVRYCTPARVKAYKGLRRPSCNGGTGCQRCWDKYNRLQRELVSAALKLLDGEAA